MKLTIRVLCLIALVPLVSGCMSASGDYVGAIYYAYGPEAALDAAGYVASPGGNALVDLERATALMELGWYQESLTALEGVRKTLEVEDALEPGTKGRAPWRPEIHEEVLLATWEMANSLALQDAVGAAAAADRAVEAITTGDCAPCAFTFTRVTAALAFEAAGRYSDALAVVSGLEGGGRSGHVIDEIKRRLEGGLAAAEPEGMAPAPVEQDRSVVLLLLLGRGPYKDRDELRVATSSEPIPWSKYLPRDPQTVSWATLELGEELVAAELTDVDELAVASLRNRAERTAAALEPGTGPKRRDLRHWASLPASMQIVVSEVPIGADVAELVYYSPDGDEVARETIEWPASWTGGRIFVIRRIP